jgi:phosphinothricin acetyltransferase
MGLGKALYRELERYLLAQNVFTVYACIAVPDETDEYLTDDSERFHAKMGYRTVGKYDRCGYKFGRWHNMIWMEKEIAEKPEKPEDFIPFSRLTGDPGRC